MELWRIFVFALFGSFVFLFCPNNRYMFTAERNAARLKF